eukprot:4267177-Ditylum_brightwellii.AAC.1
MMKERGAAVIDATTEIVTPVTVEFLVPVQTKVFHIRDAFVRLYQKLLDYEPTLKLSVLTSDTKWEKKNYQMEKHSKN